MYCRNEQAQHSFTNLTRGARLPIPEFRIYVAGLIGFVAFYGLQNMTAFAL
jgi:hypothetical protein